MIKYLAALLIICAQVGWAVEPISLSFLQVKQCFPEFAENELANFVNLNRLKDVIDSVYVTDFSLLEYRIAKFKKKDGSLRRGTLKLSDEKKKTYEIMLEEINDKGLGSILPLTSEQKTRPSLKSIGDLMVGSEILEDEYAYIDTKLKGEKLTYKKHFEDIVELEFMPQQKKKSLYCEKTSNGAVICTCKSN